MRGIEFALRRFAAVKGGRHRCLLRLRQEPYPLIRHAVLGTHMVTQEVDLRNQGISLLLRISEFLGFLSKGVILLFIGTCCAFSPRKPDGTHSLEVRSQLFGVVTSPASMGCKVSENVYAFQYFSKCCL
ncbi:hypothetical protein NPIL_121631 [Nephila pilipes]|uniref:Uncharacterized protein n=1 Tax=Nephila pilipes TaxID=299642 RepID=A0A8X6JR11_NEPPI|nr:hypothetical protein NPIL_121631 [Nephila pilipes]